MERVKARVVKKNDGSFPRVKAKRREGMAANNAGYLESTKIY